MKTTIELRDALVAWAKTKDNFRAEYQETGDLLIFAFISVKVWSIFLRKVPVWECIAIAWQYCPPDINLLSPNKALETFLKHEFTFSGDNREIVIEKKY